MQSIFLSEFLCQVANSVSSFVVLILQLMSILAASWVLLSGIASAAPSCTTVCYVATTGNDANSGLRSAPLSTILVAINQVNVGGTMFVAAFRSRTPIRITQLLIAQAPATSAISPSEIRPVIVISVPASRFQHRLRCWMAGWLVGQQRHR